MVLVVCGRWGIPYNSLFDFHQILWFLMVLFVLVVFAVLVVLVVFCFCFPSDFVVFDGFGGWLFLLHGFGGLW